MHTMRYKSQFGMYAVSQAFSPLLYVRFPKPVHVIAMWPRTVTAQNDGDFGWEARGVIVCPPSTAGHIGHQMALPDKLEPADALANDLPPKADDAIATAVPANAPFSGTCDKPFVDATAPDPVTPVYPPFRFAPPPVTQVLVEMAIASDGTLIDAWIVGNTGDRAFEPYALDAARRTHYTNAIAYCSPIPSVYRFRATFDPRP